MEGYKLMVTGRAMLERAKIRRDSTSDYFLSGDTPAMTGSWWAVMPPEAEKRVALRRREPAAGSGNE